MRAGVIAGVGFEQADQYGGFFGLQFFGSLAEEAFTGHLNAVGIFAVWNGVQVEGQQLPLVVNLLQPAGNDHLPHLRLDHAEAAVALPGVQLLGQLLADGGTTASTPVAK